MKRITKTLLLSFLMLVLGLSAATSSLNESSETTVLEEISPSQEVILSLNLLNEPGHQEGSIFTDTTFAAGLYHTCAILDDGSLNLRRSLEHLNTLDSLGSLGSQLQ